MKGCLIIFTRTPEKGKVKTRLAKGVGDNKALEIYQYLLKHSAKVASKVIAHKQVWYTNSIQKNDVWNDLIFEKKNQDEGNLGFKMQQAFQYNFNQDFQKVVIIGSDLLDIDENTINKAFQLLEQHEVVIGPALDGGYYLLGLTHYIPEIFENISWSTDKVFQQTLKRIPNKSLAFLEKKNDIDVVDDALQHEELRKIIERD